MNTSTASHRLVMENQLNITKSSQNDYDSKAIVLFSSISKRVKVAQLQLNTNLNKSPSNFLTNEAQYCGVHHNLSQSDEFTSYQTAHMFPDFVGDIDIISNSTNIKKLFKIPYSGNSVSMMMHRIENTLLIDKYDVDNNLIVKRDDLAWLNNIFNSDNLEPSDLKGKRFTNKNKNFKVIQKETLMSKFLHHSIGDSIDCDKNNQFEYKQLLPLSPTWACILFISYEPHSLLKLLLTVSLSKLTQDDKYPTKSITHRMYNQYMLWTFEGLQFLLGSDLAIFNGDNNSQLSLRLRDMSKPMNSLTGMDYWLDNLICNVNELLMCYHLNGIVKNNKTVLTEDIPHLKDSKFSPNDVKVTVKNLISFLKSNATNIGHTYWLLKEKNSDVLKLYDLTFLYSDTICQNLFTVPIALLLCRVVQNAKHNQNNGGPSNSNQILLINCLKLLNETKYPEIIASVCYLLSDIFIPINTNVRYPDLENLFFVNSLVPDNNANEEYSFLYENGVCSIDVNNLLQPSREKNEYPKFEKLKSKPTVLTVEKRCKKALYCVGRGLTIINYEKKPDIQVENEENVENVAILATSVNEKTRQNKNRRGKKKNIAVKNNQVTVHNTQHSLQCFGSKTYIWDKAISFFYKACLAFTILAEQDYLALRYGNALKNFRFAYRCQMFIFIINGDNTKFGYLLECISVCCLLIIKNWACNVQYINEMNAPNDCYDSAVKEFLETDCEACKKFIDYTFIPDNISTTFCLLNSAELCYQESVKFGTYDHDKKDLYKTLICSIYINYTTEYLEKMTDIIIRKCTYSHSNVMQLMTTSQQILTKGVNTLKSFASIKDITIMHMNMGKWCTYASRLKLFLKSENNITSEEILELLKKAKDWHSESLTILTKDRLSNLNLWIDASWEFFSATYDFVVTNQNFIYKEPDTVTDDNEKQVLGLLLNALKSCDLVNETKYLIMYKLRAAQLHERVAVVNMFKIQRNMMSEQKKQITYRECMFHYHLSYEMYLKMNQPLESLDMIISMIIVDEIGFKDVTSVQQKIKVFVSIGNTLRKCVPVLQSLLAINDNPEQSSLINKSVRHQKISSLLEKIQNVLKITIKGVMGRNPGLTEKLKLVYVESLTDNNEENKMPHLLQIVTEIINIIQFMN